MNDITALSPVTPEMLASLKLSAMNLAEGEMMSFEPAVFRALVEALEKAQQQTTESENRVRKQNRHICELFDDNTALRQRIASLEESHAQVIQSRDHYKRMSEEGLKQQLESRTVTVKLPDEIDVLLNHLEDVIPQEVFKRIDVGVWNAVSRLSATGIQVIEGEGQ